MEDHIPGTARGGHRRLERSVRPAAYPEALQRAQRPLRAGGPGSGNLLRQVVRRSRIRVGSRSSDGRGVSEDIRSVPATSETCELQHRRGAGEGAREPEEAVECSGRSVEAKRKATEGPGTVPGPLLFAGWGKRNEEFSRVCRSEICWRSWRTRVVLRSSHSGSAGRRGRSSCSRCGCAREG